MPEPDESRDHLAARVEAFRADVVTASAEGRQVDLLALVDVVGELAARADGVRELSRALLEGE